MNRNYKAVIEAAAFGAMARAFYDESGDIGELFTVTPGADLFGWCEEYLIAPHWNACERSALCRVPFGNPLDDMTEDDPTIWTRNPLHDMARAYLDAACEGIHGLSADVRQRTGLTHHLLTVGANTAGDWEGVSSSEANGYTVWTDTDGNQHAEFGGEIWFHAFAEECP